MNPRLAKWLAWSLVALAVALGLATIALVVAVTSAAAPPESPVPVEAIAVLRLSGRDWLQTPIVLGEAWGFAVLGAVLVTRQRARALGWLFCALGLVSAVEYFAGYYALFALFVAPSTLPGRWEAAWVQSWIWVVDLMLLSVFVPLLFPNGRLVSPRWRPVWWLAVGATVAWALVLAFAPGQLGNMLEGAYVRNPYGVVGLVNLTSWMASGLGVLISSALDLTLLASILIATVSLVARLRRARGVERQQIKWFTFCTVLLALLLAMLWVAPWVAAWLAPELPRQFGSFNAFDLGYALYLKVAVIGLPVATGLSILRYHLFDIDVIIRRTLIYGTLTALLAGLYLGLVIGVGGFVRAAFGLSEQEPVVLVVSTLAVASLIQPLRQWIQRFIDRRFYRNKYDAARTAAAFGATLRSEVDLAQLSAQLVAVVEETMQPAHISLWLRAPTSGAYGSHEQSGNVQAV